MKRFLVLSVLLLGLATSASAQKLDMLLDNLDRVILDKETYSRSKEERIDAIRSSLAGIKPSDRYGVYDALYREYAKYNLDSALFYAREKASLAKRSGDNSAWERSCLELADIYTNAGQYQQAEELLGLVGTPSAQYYHALHTLYSAMAATSVFGERVQAYTSLKEQYRDSLIRNLASNDVSSVFAMSDTLTN